ncbi:MAG: hypothetical protein M3019_04540 [Candidatus Dormibacteraeota bacterium]|nr:hypothetical protein [Candidatus Dormibacteraeota bacterium]
MTTHAVEAPPQPNANAFPPITALTVLSLGLVLVGGIYMTATFRNPGSYTLPLLLLIASAVLFVASFLLLARHRGFPWPVFLSVARWALLAYVVIAGMIEFSFIHNKVSGTPLLLLSLMLVMFALDVPLSIASTVARFASPAD